jgi:hypothetical protein
MPKTVIMPTLRCFDDALDYIETRAKLNIGDWQALVLAHGILLVPDGKEEGTPFAHAWVEEGDAVIQRGIIEGVATYYAVKKAEFETLMRPVKVTRYTVRQALDENWKSNHYGPWEPVYRALCGAGRIYYQ